MHADDWPKLCGEMIDFEVRENDIMLKAKDNVIKKSDPLGSHFVVSWLRVIKH